ncbi:hypothetical protein [Cereibacter sediminicola]|uniref:hypothetical protein n=1 Tax=Cereibacter sediminicola TaxID=2584941 RepID=UPI00119F5670|nr:hypothetical protein [Cereibacter sediminicola]
MREDLTFHSVDEAFQFAFDKIEALGKRVGELELETYGLRATLQAVVAVASAHGGLDREELVDVVEAMIQGSQERAQTATPEQVRSLEVYFAHLREIVAAPGERQLPLFQVIDGDRQD